MAKDRNFYFRVKPADEALMFERVDVEAEGLYSKMRRDAFRSVLRGFLVEFNGAPMAIDDMADGYRMTNGRFKARLSELHTRQIIQTAREYGDSLRTLKSAWATKKVSAYGDLLAKLNGKPDDVYVVPALVDEVLDSIVGSGTGSEGWEEGEDGRKRRKKRDEGTPIGTPIGGRSNVEQGGLSASHLPNSQSQSQNENSSSNPSSPDRETPAADACPRAEEVDERLPMPIDVYTARCHEIAEWQKTIGPMSEERFEAEFEAKFAMSWATWCAIRQRMEAALTRRSREAV